MCVSWSVSAFQVLVFSIPASMPPVKREMAQRNIHRPDEMIGTGFIRVSRIQKIVYNSIT